jgi:hypothetical protein
MAMDGNGDETGDGTEDAVTRVAKIAKVTKVAKVKVVGQKVERCEWRSR